MASPSIVVINNNPVIVRLLVQALADDGYQVFGAVGDREGYATIHTHHPDLVLLDDPHTAPAGDWYILALMWPYGVMQRVYPLEMPLKLDHLRAKLAQALGTSTEPCPMERTRGAADS